jgi:hypothetical protein
MGRKEEGGWSRITRLAGCGAVELRRGFILEADDNESYRISTPGVNTFRESAGEGTFSFSPPARALRVPQGLEPLGHELEAEWLVETARARDRSLEPALSEAEWVEPKAASSP